MLGLKLSHVSKRGPWKVILNLNLSRPHFDDEYKGVLGNTLRDTRETVVLIRELGVDNKHQKGYLTS